MSENDKIVKMKDMIKEYLEINGLSTLKNICEYVLSKRKTSTPNSISVTLYGNKDIFVKKGYGMWDIKGNNNSKELKICIIRKMDILLKHYKELLKEKGVNGDTRLAGVDFTEKELKIIEKCKEKYDKR